MSRRSQETLLTMDLSEISIIEKEERCLVTVDVNRETSFEEEVELITANYLLKFLFFNKMMGETLEEKTEV